MGCTSPITVDTSAGPVQVRCKQCVGCRITRQSSWTFRNLMEAQTHSCAAFVTLTYRDETCPDTLDYRDFSLFLKRLRKKQGQIRFFSVGEYGSKTGRPHWHALIYGMQGQKKGHWDTELWPHGYAYIGQVTPESIRYTARYCLKFGEKGEEAMMRCSLKPALGYNSVRQLAGEMGMRNYKLEAVPTIVKVEGKAWPLDETMRKAFAEGYEEIGGKIIPDKNAVFRHMEYVLEMVGGDPISQAVYRRQAMFEAMQAGKFRMKWEEI